MITSEKNDDLFAPIFVCSGGFSINNGFCHVCQTILKLTFPLSDIFEYICTTSILPFIAV